MLFIASFVHRALSILFPPERDALPKKSDDVASNKRKAKEQKIVDSHFSVNLISVDARRSEMHKSTSSANSIECKA